MTKESDIAGAFGISQEQLRVMRFKLTEGKHFKKQGNAVVYSAEGVQRVSELLAVPNPLAEKKEGGAENEPVGPVTLYVKKLVPNRRLLIAVATHEEVRGDVSTPLRVMVRDSSKFCLGNVLTPCRHIQTDLYAFEGRAPRSKKKSR